MNLTVLFSVTWCSYFKSLVVGSYRWSNYVQITSAIIRDRFRQSDEWLMQIYLWDWQIDRIGQTQLITYWICGSADPALCVYLILRCTRPCASHWEKRFSLTPYELRQRHKWACVHFISDKLLIFTLQHCALFEEHVSLWHNPLNTYMLCWCNMPMPVPHMAECFAFNSFAPQRLASALEWLTFKFISGLDILNIFNEITLRWISQDPSGIDDSWRSTTLSLW